MKNKYMAYAQATQTVAKTRQIVLLYDGIIRFMRQAKEAIEGKRFEERYNLLIKATEIIGGLQGCLDFEKGGEVARVLYYYYSSLEARIFKIHHSNSVDLCDEVIEDVKQMRDVWEEIDKSATSGEGEDPAPAEPPVAAAPVLPEKPPGITMSA